MRISFDLDETLLTPGAAGPNLPFGEALREGALELMQDLARSHEVWIYTSSLRRPRVLQAQFLALGVSIGRVINGLVHEEERQKAGGVHWPSKYPAHFGIDLHVDDSQGVAIEAERWGFQVLIVAPDDLEWALKVRKAVERSC